MFKQEAQEAFELLQNMISIPSLSRTEDELANFLERYIEERGYTCNRLDNNIWTMSPGFDPQRPTILLNSHIDTVKAVSGWQREPFKPSVEGEALYGLGSNDAGASVVSLLSVFFILVKETQKYNIIFAASAEEEVSGENGMRKLRNELPQIDFAVVGEPTQMQLAVAEKGLMVLDCTVHGKAGHAARNEGENAIYKAMTDIKWLETYEFPKKSDLLGSVKTTVTQIEAGTQHNVIPDRCSFVVDVRSNELYSNNELLSLIEEQLSCSVRARSVRLNSSATPLSHPFVERGRELGLELFGSPTLSDQSLMSYPSVKIGPGDSARSHTADEYILFSEISSAIDCYYRLLNNLNLDRI